MKEVAIECRNIKKSYGKDEAKIEALKGIDLKVTSGELTLLVGPSGSGKTTLLSIITNLLTPDSGQLFLLGIDMGHLNADQKADFCQKNLGIVFQSLFLVPTLTILENVALPLLVAGKEEDEANLRAMALLEKVHLSHRANNSPDTLSKGQQQRVAIARAMVNNAEILVCDEPTSALDQTSGTEIMTLLQHLATDFHKTLLVVTHDHRIFSFANQIININDGKVVAHE